MGKVVPGPGVQKICDKIEALLEHRSGLAEIAQGRRAPTSRSWHYRSLEECDQLAREVSVQGTAGGDPRGGHGGGGGDRGRGNAHTRPHRRGGSSDPADRPLLRLPARHGCSTASHVLGVLELSTVEDPVGRKRICGNGFTA